MASKVSLKDELLYPSKYLSHVDLNGNDMTLTIGVISRQELIMKGGTKKNKPVIGFKDHPKELVLNVTNAESIAQMYGWKAEAWVGKQVTFFPTKAKFGKEMVDCIRVREKAPAPTVDEDAAKRLADYMALLNPDTVNLEVLNTTIVEAIKAIKAKDPIRVQAWNATLEFAAKFGCEFDKEAKLFVQKPKE